MASWNTCILQIWSVFLHFVDFFRIFFHLVITFLICFSFIQIFPNNHYNLSIITFLLWSVNFIYLEFWIIGEIINLIVLPAINITGKIDNYRYNFLVVEKNINYNNSTFKKLEIWHQWRHWWRHHIATDLTYVNFFLIFLFFIDRTMFLPIFFRK